MSQTGIENFAGGLSDEEVDRGRVSGLFDTYCREDYLTLIAHLRFQGASLATAEDVVQEVMINMMTNWEEIRNPKAYARGAAMKIFLRHKKRIDGRETEFDLQRHDRQDGTDVLGEVIQRQGTRDVHALLQQLPPQQRNAMSLFITNEWTAQQIAEATGQNPATVRSNLRHAARKLRTLLGETDISEVGRKEDTEWTSRPDSGVGNATQDAERDADIGDPELRRFLDSTFQAELKTLRTIIDIEQRLHDLHHALETRRPSAHGEGN